MSKIHLQSVLQPEATLVSNQFLDQYMPQANGDFVKVYLYLLRCLSDGTKEIKPSVIADRLLCTEGDILRALRYWEEKKLLAMSFEEDGGLGGISLREPKANVTPISEARKNALTPDRVKELKENEEIVQLLYIAEQYLGKALTATETRKLLFFYDELHMSLDLIDYLIEYCVGRGHKNLRYIETVAQAWVKEGITSVEAAKKKVSHGRKEYFAILSAMGISGRNPVDQEQKLMRQWLDDYGMPLELVEEACSRTVMATGQPSFQYTDKILQGWHAKGVHSLEAVNLLDQERQQSLPKREGKSPASNPSRRASNRFNNFSQREYDFQEYEKRLLNQ